MLTKWIRRAFALVAAAVIFAGGMGFERVQAQGPAWPEIAFEPVVEGLSRPLGINHAGDGSGRLFLLEQGGVIRIFQNGALLEEPFLDISSQVSCCGERGLLGLAFPPGFAAKQHFYVNYTDLNGDTVIARYSVSGDPNRADPNSEVPVLEVAQPYANHNGGQLVFGPDGYLYIGLGDGGGTGDPQRRAQNPGDMLGKMLRIDTEGPGCVTAQGRQPNYCIPANNPFLTNTAYRPEIWALGLRNPWRFSFDRLTGDLYTADVGQGNREEINFQSSGSLVGKNYGWNVLEGSLCYPSGSATGCTPPPAYAPPVEEYDHSAGCSVTGGAVFRGPANPALLGIYFYGDFCSGRIWGLRSVDGRWETAQLVETEYSISSFGEDEAGSLYVADLSAGAIYRVVQGGERTDLPIRLYLPVMP